MKNVAVILSGGVGSRFGGALPKQFTKLAGKSIIEYTIDAFERSEEIDEIFVVSQTQHIQKTWEIIRNNKWKKIKSVVTGGKERFDSTYSALQVLINYEGETKILFHDAVRPLVNSRIISECITALDDFDAVDVVIPSADTLVEVFDDGCISNIPNRNNMRRGQTPQGFRLGVIQKAYKKAIENKKYIFTCDCGVVRAMLPAVKVATVEGEERNMKVTHSIDLFVAEKYLQSGSCNDYFASDKNDNLTDLRGKVIVIFGGSSGIGLEMKNTAIINGAHVEIASRKFNGVDVTNIESIRVFLEKVNDKYGAIDYVVNTAGLLIKKPIDMLTMSEISDLIAVNYTGAINVAIEVKKYLINSKGMLLNFTSSSYTRGRAYYSIYSSANAAIANLTQALAEEWEVDGIKVNCINPERTATPMRLSNFGIEPKDLLLSADQVASVSLLVLLSKRTGIVVDIRKDGR